MVTDQWGGSLLSYWLVPVGALRRYPLSAMINKWYQSSFHQCITTNPNSGTQYKTLPTKVRNHIDHPDSAQSFTTEELEMSIMLMREILLKIP